MATVSSVATSVDVLTADERKLVVEGLSSLLASYKRAANSARFKGMYDIASAYGLSCDRVEALIVKFR